jgi:ABC-2 type transport system ATP-binding protein
MSNVLETTHLSKRYGRQWALQDCTLALPAGRVAALVGPNGAGKTTLLHLSVGLLEPTTGSVQVFGCSPLKQTTQTLPRLGFVAQDHPLYKDFTVADLLTLGCKLNPRWDDALAKARMQKLGIPLDRRTGKLSGGQQAQVALVLALAKRPELLLRTNGPLFDPSWEVQEVSLEDIVLAYLSQQATTRLSSSQSTQKQHGMEVVQ